VTGSISAKAQSLVELERVLGPQPEGPHARDARMVEETPDQLSTDALPLVLASHDDLTEVGPAHEVRQEPRGADEVRAVPRTDEERRVRYEVAPVGRLAGHPPGRRACEEVHQLGDREGSRLLPVDSHGLKVVKTERLPSVVPARRRVAGTAGTCKSPARDVPEGVRNAVNDHAGQDAAGPPS
jgi:hypothetical protein